MVKEARKNYLLVQNQQKTSVNITFMIMETIGSSFIFKILTIIFYLNTNGVLGVDETYNIRHHDSTIMCSISAWVMGDKDWIIDESMIDPFLCTHLIYSYAGIDPLSNRITSPNPSRDLSSEDGGESGGFKKIANLKNKFPHLKIMVAIGGWIEGSIKLSSMASSPQKRKSFIDSVTKFVRNYNFDGVDIAWSYPTDRGGKAEDKDNFLQLLKELKSEFGINKWILATSLSKSEYLIRRAYDVTQISNIVDHMNIITFDYNGPWENQTGFNSPLYQGSGERDKNNNIDNTIQLFIGLGANRDKINLGVPFYGHKYVLEKLSKETVGVKSNPGPDDGFINYEEICELNLTSWTKHWDTEQRVVYAHKDKLWINYENERSVNEKVAYAVNHRLGGIYVFQVEMDDAHNKCKNGSMPLLREVNKVLAKGFEKIREISPHRLPHEISSKKQCQCNGAWTLHYTLVNWTVLIILLNQFIRTIY